MVRRRRPRTRGELIFSGIGMIIFAIVLMVIVWFNQSAITVVPYWVLAVLLSVFIFAGLWTLLGALGREREATLAMVLMIAAMGVPGVWLLWSPPGTLSCSASGALSFLAGDGCRVALGIGGTAALMLAVAWGVGVVVGWNRSAPATNGENTTGAP